MAEFGEPTNELLADMMDQAADVLAVEGWQQGSLYADYPAGERGHGAACAYGALKKVEYRNRNKYPDEIDLAYVAANEVGAFLGIRLIGDWNDQPERNQGEVEDALRSTAKKLRG